MPSPYFAPTAAWFLCCSDYILLWKPTSGDQQFLCSNAQLVDYPGSSDDPLFSGSGVKFLIFWSFCPLTLWLCGNWAKVYCAGHASPDFHEFSKPPFMNTVRFCPSPIHTKSPFTFVLGFLFPPLSVPNLHPLWLPISHSFSHYNFFALYVNPTSRLTALPFLVHLLISKSNIPYYFTKTE